MPGEALPPSSEVISQGEVPPEFWASFCGVARLMGADVGPLLSSEPSAGYDSSEIEPPPELITRDDFYRIAQGNEIPQSDATRGFNGLVRLSHSQVRDEARGNFPRVRFMTPANPGIETYRIDPKQVDGLYKEDFVALVDAVDASIEQGVALGVIYEKLGRGISEASVNVWRVVRDRYRSPS